MKLVNLNLRNFSQNINANKKIIHTDVLIVGGGASGASLACALSLSPHFQKVDNKYRLMMIDNSKLPSMKSYKFND